MKKIISILITILLSIVVFSGCLENNKENIQTSKLERFSGKWGEVYFTAKNQSVVFGEIYFYKNGTGKSYYRSPGFSEKFSFKLEDTLIYINQTDRFYITPEGNETSILKCKYNFTEKDKKLTLTGIDNEKYSYVLLKEYNLSSTSEIECGNNINMTVSETLFSVKNVTSFNVSIYNPVYAPMVIHECFILGKYNSSVIFGGDYIGDFTKEGEYYIIDLNNISENKTDCNNVLLQPYEKRKYKFMIKNAKEGMYIISMGMAIMNDWCLLQGFANSNTFMMV